LRGLFRFFEIADTDATSGFLDLLRLRRKVRERRQNMVSRIAPMAKNSRNRHKKLLA